MRTSHAPSADGILEIHPNLAEELLREVFIEHITQEVGMREGTVTKHTIRPNNFELPPRGLIDRATKAQVVEGSSEGLGPLVKTASLGDLFDDLVRHSTRGLGEERGDESLALSGQQLFHDRIQEQFVPPGEQLLPLRGKEVALTRAANALPAKSRRDETLLFQAL
jgi:hypothetical protein